MTRVPRIYHELPDDEDNDKIGTTIRAMNQAKPHYIAMGGLHGCTPSHCDVYDTWQDAVIGLVDQYELGKKRARILAKHSNLELNIKHDHNEYVEIVECDCDTPEVHSDV